MPRTVLFFVLVPAFVFGACSKDEEVAKEAVEAVADEAAPADPEAKRPTAAPGEDKPGEDKPGEDKPGEDKPGEDKPGEDKPGEDKPGEEETRDAAKVVPGMIEPAAGDEAAEGKPAIAEPSAAEAPAARVPTAGAPVATERPNGESAAAAELARNRAEPSADEPALRDAAKTAPAAGALARPVPVAGADEAPSPAAAPIVQAQAEPPLDIAGYLSAVDLERVLGKKLSFRRADLPGVSPASGYNALYYAPSRGAEFGVSVQVWQDRNLVDSRTRFSTLRNTYSNVAPTNKVAEMGFRAHFNGVVSLVFADPRRPVVASVSCSTRICDANALIELASRVAQRMRGR